MEDTPQENAQDIALYQSVAGFCKKSGRAQSGESQEVIAAYLEKRQHIGLLEKLQNTVVKPTSIPVLGPYQ